jgi:hypothetical protein
MGEDLRPRRTPGGALPPRLVRPRQPETNGHTPHPPATPAEQPQDTAADQPRAPGGPDWHDLDGTDRRRRHLGVTWQELDAEDEEQREHERVAFRRVADVVPSAGVESSGRPSTAVIAGVLIVVALVVLAVVLYRMAPP